jgi:transcription elongation factor GreA
MSKMKIHQLTEEGKRDLEAQLEVLKVQREANIIAIQEARSQGDLSENADYSAAREEQSRIAAEIARLEDILKHSKIISNKDDSDIISIGKRVRLLINGMEKEYSIVSTIETNPKSGKISNESPLGEAINGHVPGDVVVFRTESDREVVVEILEVVKKES